MLRAQNLAFSPTRFHEDPKNSIEAYDAQTIDREARASKWDFDLVA